jgi:hypothetical protein
VFPPFSVHSDGFLVVEDVPASMLSGNDDRGDLEASTRRRTSHDELTLDEEVGLFSFPGLYL